MDTEPERKIKDILLLWLILTAAVKSPPHCPCCCSPTPGKCRRHPLPLTRLSGQWSIQLRMGEVYRCRDEPEDSSCRARKVRIKLYQMSGGDLKIKKKFDAGHNAGLIVPPLHVALKFVLSDQISTAQHLNHAHLHLVVTCIFGIQLRSKCYLITVRHLNFTTACLGAVGVWIYSFALTHLYD